MQRAVHVRCGRLQEGERRARAPPRRRRAARVRPAAGAVVPAYRHRVPRGRRRVLRVRGRHPVRLRGRADMLRRHRGRRAALGRWGAGEREHRRCRGEARLVVRVVLPRGRPGAVPHQAHGEERVPRGRDGRPRPRVGPVRGTRAPQPAALRAERVAAYPACGQTSAEPVRPPTFRGRRRPGSAPRTARRSADAKRGIPARCLHRWRARCPARFAPQPPPPSPRCPRYGRDR